MPPEHKVILGLVSAGKTTILYQFLMNEVVHTHSTIGGKVEEAVLQKTHFLMWDFRGQEALNAVWTVDYFNVEFIILVIDSTDGQRLLTTGVSSTRYCPMRLQEVLQQLQLQATVS